MLTSLEKVRLLKISLIILLSLLIVASLYANSYFNDLKTLTTLDQKKVSAFVADEAFKKKLDDLKIATGYSLKIFANTLNQPVFITPGPFNGIIVADRSSNSLYQLVDNTGDNVSDFKTKIIGGFDNLSAVFWKHPFLYAADATGIYQYDYQALEAVASDREKIVEASDYGYEKIVRLEKLEKGIGIFTTSGKVYQYSDKATGLSLLYDAWPLCPTDKTFIFHPCLNSASFSTTTLQEVTEFYFTIINSSLFPAEDQGDILAILIFKNGESKIVKIAVDNGQITAITDFITGWSLASAKPGYIEFSADGQLFIADAHQGVIYKIIKINN